MGDDRSNLTPDELEQRQRLDGTFEAEDTVKTPSDEPMSPDVVEQRQRRDGTVDPAGAINDPSDEPLSPDQIDQRRPVSVDDDEDDEPRPE